MQKQSRPDEDDFPFRGQGARKQAIPSSSLSTQAHAEKTRLAEAAPCALSTAPDISPYTLKKAIVQTCDGDRGNGKGSIRTAEEYSAAAKTAKSSFILHCPIKSVFMSIHSKPILLHFPQKAFLIGKPLCSPTIESIPQYGQTAVPDTSAIHPLISFGSKISRQ